jgi:hypothetical protein
VGDSTGRFFLVDIMTVFTQSIHGMFFAIFGGISIAGSSSLPQDASGVYPRGWSVSQMTERTSVTTAPSWELELRGPKIADEYDKF